MHHHHDAEEAIFFLDVGELLKSKASRKRILDRIKLYAWIRQVLRVLQDLSCPSLREIEEYRSSLCGTPLTKHLHDEIETLALASHLATSQARVAAECMLQRCTILLTSTTVSTETTQRQNLSGHLFCSKYMVHCYKPTKHHNIIRGENKMTNHHRHISRQQERSWTEFDRHPTYDLNHELKRSQTVSICSSCSI